MTDPASRQGARLIEKLRGATEVDGALVADPAPDQPQPALQPPARPLVTGHPPDAAENRCSAPGRANAPADLAPLHLRLGLLQLLRVALAAITAGTALLLPQPLGGRMGPGLAAVSVGYVASSTLLELLRRRMSLRSAALVSGLVLFDGAYLAIVMAFTGGPQSVLSFLVLVHVIAVTLLLSFRNGLKAALWHALLLFFITWLTQAGVVGARPSASPEQAAVLGALGLLVVAVATAWFSALNEGELRRGKAELRALAEMAGRMAGTRDRDALLHALLQGAAEAFGHHRAAVVLADGAKSTAAAFVLRPDGSMHEVATGSEEAAAALCRAGPPDDHHSASAPLLLRALDATKDPLLVAALPGASNVMVAPLVVDGQPIGALAVERGGGSRARVTARTVDLLAQFAAHAALALRAAALQAVVEHMASTDALTGLANRRCFADALDRELALAVRRGESCGLIVLDVDHFKLVNDQHGHQTGDEVLEEVARALGHTARETDIVARYGGEEFVVILPGCKAPEAVEVAERLRAAVAASPSPVPVTISAGVAVFPADGDGAAALVRAADTALYKAKRQGRDRTVRFRRPRSLVVAEAS